MGSIMHRILVLTSLVLITVAIACAGPAQEEAATARPAATPEQTTAPVPTPTATPQPTPTPQVGFAPGTYRVGEDLRPGIYAGNSGTGLLDSCYWARLRGVSGELSDLIANDNAIGQFYVEVLETDAYFEVKCSVIPIDAWPEPDRELSKITPGTYLVGRDISPGTYRGEAGTSLLDSCYWSRLSGVTGDISDLIANDNPIGFYFVTVQDSDYALSTTCELELDSTAKPAAAPELTPTLAPEPTAAPEPTPASELTVTSEPTPTLEPTAMPEPTATPRPGFNPGTYQVGIDILPGIYAGKAGAGPLDSCYWERLAGVSGDFSDLIANDNPSGQFYVEVLGTDAYFKTNCAIIPINAWPMPDAPLSRIEPGTYLVGRDIVPGTYHGEAGTGLLDSCYWERLSGVSGEFSDLITNDNPVGSYFVTVQDSDFALSTACELELVK